MDALHEQQNKALRVCELYLIGRLNTLKRNSDIHSISAADEVAADLRLLHESFAAYDSAKADQESAKANGGWLRHAAWAWRRAGMDGWALGHIKPTKENCHVTNEEFTKFEIRELVFADSRPLPPPPEQTK
jgi:hypothetical protein